MKLVGTMGRKPLPIAEESPQTSFEEQHEVLSVFHLTVRSGVSARNQMSRCWLTFRTVNVEMAGIG